MSDPWTQHLQKYELLELDALAHTAGYRIRIANDWTFDLEYQGGLTRYYGAGLAVKTFEQSESGKAEATTYLQIIKSEIA